MSHPSLQSRVVHRDDAVHHGGLRAASDVTIRLWHASEAWWTATQLIDWLNSTTEKSASYTYVIDRDGTIVRMARGNIITYHAGDSAWPNPKVAASEDDRPNGGRSVNRVSLGICFCNNARNGDDPLTPAQIESGLWLAAALDEEYPIARDLMHYEVSPGRKVDTLPALSGDDWRAMLAAYWAEA